MAATKTNLHGKLARIQGELKAIGKSGYNSFANYKYSTEDDVLDAIRPALSSAGISVTSSVVSEVLERITQPKVKMTATVVVETTLTDSETGEAVKIRMPGYAEDTGDKAIYKAVTGACKYAVQKALSIASSDDPERTEAPAPAPAHTAPKAAPKPEPAPEPQEAPAAPAPKPVAKTAAKPAAKVEESPNLTEEERLELQQAINASGYAKEDVTAYVSKLPKKKIFFPEFQRAMDYFSVVKAERVKDGSLIT